MWQYNYCQELSHHGIKGQKWGIRRFQKKDGSLTSDGKKRYSDNQDSKDNGDSKEHKRLSKNQKKAIAVGAAVVATALATYGAYKLGAFNKFKSKGMDAVGNILKDPSTGFKVKPKSTSILEDLKAVNPSGSNTNCRACSIATILRQRGLDVKAKGDVPGGDFSEAISKAFKGAKVSEMNSPSKERIVNFITKRFGEGSSGAMATSFKYANGVNFQHAFNWSVKDGKINFMDGQKGLDDISRFLDLIDKDGLAEIVRLDNLDINLDGIREFIEDR